MFELDADTMSIYKVATLAPPVKNMRIPESRGEPNNRGQEEFCSLRLARLLIIS
jgi:hypothetical protein